METKICKKCGKELPIDEFEKAKQSKDGHLSTCKKCRGAFKGMPDFITCPICKKTKEYYYFSVAPRSKTSRLWCCKECYKLKPENVDQKSFRVKFDTEYRNRVLKQKRDEHKRNIIHYMWYRAKQRSVKYNYEFNIEESDIIIPEICPLLEIPIILGEKDSYENTPSLDRIDNSKGYVKGNIWVISKKANSMKNSATPQELTTFCKNITRYSLNITENECNESKSKEA